MLQLCLTPPSLPRSGSLYLLPFRMASLRLSIEALLRRLLQARALRLLVAFLELPVLPRRFVVYLPPALM